MVALGFLLTGASLFAFGFRAQRLLSSASSVQAQQTVVRVEALSPSPTILPAPSASAADANAPQSPPAPEHDPRSSQR
jgi:hypothetical protein